jgi:hypothetical protein
VRAGGADEETGRAQVHKNIARSSDGKGEGKPALPVPEPTDPHHFIPILGYPCPHSLSNWLSWTQPHPEVPISHTKFSSLSPKLPLEFDGEDFEQPLHVDHGREHYLDVGSVPLLLSSFNSV